MGQKKPYIPPRLTVHDPTKIPKFRENRFYTRYHFKADAKVSVSDAAISAQVMNISFGGCRLLINSHLNVGAAITLKIHTPAEFFESTAKVVHSVEKEAGVMFDKVGPESLLVLEKWIGAAKAAIP
jgi:PilZ domain